MDRDGMTYEKKEAMRTVGSSGLVGYAQAQAAGSIVVGDAVGDAVGAAGSIVVGVAVVAGTTAT